MCVCIVGVVVSPCTILGMYTVANNNIFQFLSFALKNAINHVNIHICIMGVGVCGESLIATNIY